MIREKPIDIRDDDMIRGETVKDIRRALLFYGDHFMTCDQINRFFNRFIIEERNNKKTKTGYWRYVDINAYACSNCGHCFSIVPEDNSIKDYKCCPNCICPMSESQESEEKEKMSEGYKSAYQQDYSDAKHDFRKKSKTMESVSDTLTVTFDSCLPDKSALCVSRKVNDNIIVLKIVSGEQADILYRLLTEQMTKEEAITEYLLHGAKSLVKEHPDLVRNIWNCSSCEHTEDECKDCYPELGYKNNKAKRDTEAVKEFVGSDAFMKLMESLDEQDRAATEDTEQFLRDIKEQEE